MKLISAEDVNNLVVQLEQRIDDIKANLDQIKKSLERIDKNLKDAGIGR